MPRLTLSLALGAVFLRGAADAYVVTVARAPHATRAAAATMVLPSDDDLFASLRARMAASEEKSMPPPLGPDEVGAECMGPQDVVDYCMKSMLAQAEGCSTDGCRAMLAFAQKCEDKPEDFVGQLQPGYFNDPQAFTDYLAAQPRYATLTQLDEFKCMGTPDFSDMSRRAAQKILVKNAGANWEDLMVNMQMVEVETPAVDEEGQATTKKKRWLITSIYKQGEP